MNVRVENWTIKKLIDRREKINKQPEYQRGDVWKPIKKKLLIDSILRGIDIPKFYLRKLDRHMFNYEVADGQQRLNSIYAFFDNKIKLDSRIDKGLDLSRVGNFVVGGKNFDELNKEKQKNFLNYKITIAVITGARNDEVRVLFGRLQLGTSLNPAEKRNAIISIIGSHIDAFALNHKFFSKSKISISRYKHQDYLAHALALLEYDNKKDLKADLLYNLYLDENIKIDQKKLQKIDNILDIIYALDRESKVKIVNKFSFLDIFWFLSKEYNNLIRFDTKGFAREFEEFERLRIKYKSDPKVLIKKKKPSRKEKYLYDYILAFKYEGALKESINKRHRAINYFFSKYLMI